MATMARVLFLLSLQLAAGAASSSLHPLIPARLALRPRAASAAPTRSTRRRGAPTAPASVRTAGLRRQRAATRLEEEDFAEEIEVRAPNLSELRDQLGPVGRCVATAVELGVTTAGSYVSGGVLGYVGGSVMGLSSLFGPDLGSLGARFGALHARALASCGSWAALSAAFSGCNGLVRACRGDREDGWNAVAGSALAGAFLSRGKGPAAMAQGGATYAGFTYLLDRFFGAEAGREAPRASGLLYADVPLDD